MIKTNKKLSLLIIFFITVAASYAQTDITTDDVRVAYTYRFTELIEWPNQERNKPFTIGVFSNDKPILEKFEYLAKKKKIQNREIRIVSLNSNKQIQTERLNILIINESKNSSISEIFKLIESKNTLLITNNCLNPEAVMINFLPSEQEETLLFEINKRNTLKQNLIINNDILLLGGSYIDVQELFQEKEQELVQEKEKLETSNKEIEKQRSIIQSQDKLIEQKELLVKEKEKTIASNEKAIAEQNVTIAVQTNKLDSQKIELNDLALEIEQKQSALNERTIILQKQESKITAQQEDIKETQESLINQKNKIISQLELIKKQEQILASQNSQLKQHRVIFIISFLIILLAFTLVYFIYRSFIIKRKANIKLKEYNDEILAQNEEIKAQREELVTARDKLEATNFELEKLSIVASQTNNAVIIVDNEDNIEWVNEGFSRTFGYKLTELTEKFGKNIHSHQSQKEFHLKLKECKETKKTIEYFIESFTKSGKKLWLHSSLTPILDKNGDIKKLIAIETNVTDLKEAQESIILQKNEIEIQKTELEEHRFHLENLVEQRTNQLLRAKEQAEESDRMKSSFIANMSHEIRTPLNAVVGFSGLLNDNQLSKEKKSNYVNLIKTNATSLVRLIDDIIDLSSIEAGKLTIQKADCEINSLLDELFLSYTRKAKEDDNHLEIKLIKPEKSHKLTISTDKTRLIQVFTNLLNNALKFTEKGYIEFGYKNNTDSTISFWVKDTGIGISPENQLRIFERFYKIEENKTKLYRGTGLGLSISKAIISDLGGKIELISEVGKGSKFVFTHPIR